MVICRFHGRDRLFVLQLGLRGNMNLEEGKENGGQRVTLLNSRVGRDKLVLLLC